MSYEGKVNEGRTEEEKQSVGERGRRSDERSNDGVEGEGGDEKKG